MQHNVFTFFSVHNCLDEEFDAPDVEADRELCRALVAGRAGLHPDGWGNHDPLPLRWLLRKRAEPEEAYTPPLNYTNVVQPRKEWERERKRPGPKPKPPAPIGWWVKDDVGVEGEVELTCDDCDAKFRQTAYYGHGRRPAAAAMLRAMAHTEGWTHIVGCDRCPRCSQIPAPEAEGDGAGAHHGDEQHR